MDRAARFILTLIVVILSCSYAPAQDPQPRQNPGDIVQQTSQTYQEFVEQFRLVTDVANRTLLTGACEKKLIETLQPLTSDDKIESVLPQLAKMQIVRLDQLFISTFESHPRESVKALALFSFAKYCGNNRRDEKALRCLELVKQHFGSIRYNNSNFAKAADDAIYFLKNLAVGKAAPRFVAEDADGVMFRLEDYEGKVVMLRFWGDWCPACRAMYPFERELVRDQKNRPFALIGINSDSLERCRTAQRRENLVWRTVWDEGDTTGPISRIFQVAHWPTIIVIDDQGIIRMRTQGLAKPQLTSLLEKLIAKAETRSQVAQTK